MTDGRETFASTGRDCVRSRIAGELTEGIASGAYSPGERLVAESGSITRALAARGVPDYVRRDSRITAVLPPPEIAALLAQPACRPALRVQSVNEGANGVAVECATTCFAGDRLGLRVYADG